MTIAAVIMIVIMSIFIMSGAGSPFSLFGIGISIHHLYQLADGGGPLTVQLATKLLMSEPFSEGSDGLGIGDVGMEFLVFEKHLMKSRRDSLED